MAQHGSVFDIFPLLAKFGGSLGITPASRGASFDAQNPGPGTPARVPPPQGVFDKADAFLNSTGGNFLMNLAAQSGFSTIPGSPVGAVGRAGVATQQQALQKRFLDAKFGNKSASSLFGTIDPSKFTPASIKKFESSKKFSDLELNESVGNDPAAIREFEFVKGLSPKDQSLFFKVQRDPRFTNIPGAGFGAPNQATGEFDVSVPEQTIVEGLGTRAGTEAGAAVTGQADAQAVIDAPKQLAGAQATIVKIDGVLEEAKLALDAVGPTTAGFLGSKISGISGTPAFALGEKIKTLQANLGFKELQEMRANSPTGGALGQVSERELALLEAALVSLNQANSPTELRRGLEKVIKHYDNWKEVIRQSQQRITTGATEGVAARAQEAIDAL